MVRNSGTPRLTGLLGYFTPPEALFALAHDANRAMQSLVDRAIAAGALRGDVTGADLTLIATQVATVETREPTAPPLCATATWCSHCRDSRSATPPSSPGRRRTPTSSKPHGER